jgi:3-dehydroquinate synthase
MLKSLTVDLHERGYPILIGDAFNNIQLLASKISGRRLVIVSNPTVASLYRGVIDSILRPHAVAVNYVEVPDGESFKSFQSLEYVCSELLKLNADRKTILVALGGGVIGDLTGFAASIYQRGIDFIQVPTTLLAQVDSSVGGKTAINHPLGKNMIGAFHQPIAVLSDISTLQSLPSREFAAGMAEVIKHGLILDRGYFDWLQINAKKIAARDSLTLTQMVLRSCEIKADIVKRDERETLGLRALLNLGHTFGHAIESATQYKQYLHGEAVAIGTCLAAKFSQQHNGLAQGAVDRIESVFTTFVLPIQLPKASISPATMLGYMRNDKKNEQAKLNLILLPEIGRAVLQKGVDETTVMGFLEKQFAE